MTTSHHHVTLTELLETWQRWSYRDTLTRLIAQADADGKTERAGLFRRVLARELQVSPLEALAANHELTSLLRGWQWHAIRAAREAGTTGTRSLGPLGVTADQALAEYLGHIEGAEQHDFELIDTTPYRAMLDDPAPNPVRSLSTGEKFGARAVHPVEPAVGALVRSGR